MNRAFVSTVLGLATAFLAFPAAAELLKLGIVTTLSGPGAPWGEAMVGAAELAAEDVNKNGGLDVGGKKYTVAIIAYDDKYKANEALTAMNRLIFDDHVKYAIAPGSAGILAVLPVTTENKIITIGAAFTPKMLSPEHKYSFRCVIPSDVFSNPQIAWVVGKLGVRRIGGLFPNDESGQQVAAANEAAYKAAGARFVAKEFFERERVDFVPLLTRTLAAGIDAFELDGNSPQTAGLLVKQLRELGFTGPIIRTGADATSDILQIAGPAASEGLYVHQPIDVTYPPMAEYIKRFETKYRTAMNGFSPFFYANIKMLFAGMQRAGTADDTDKIRESMLSLHNFDTVLGPTSWTGQKQWGSNQQLHSVFYIAQIRSGKSVVLAKCNDDKCS